MSDPNTSGERGGAELDPPVVAAEIIEKAQEEPTGSAIALLAAELQATKTPALDAEAFSFMLSDLFVGARTGHPSQYNDETRSSLPDGTRAGFDAILQYVDEHGLPHEFTPEDEEDDSRSANTGPVSSGQDRVHVLGNTQLRDGEVAGAYYGSDHLVDDSGVNTDIVYILPTRDGPYSIYMQYREMGGEDPHLVSGLPSADRMSTAKLELYSHQEQSNRLGPAGTEIVYR